MTRRQKMDAILEVTSRVRALHRDELARYDDVKVCHRGVVAVLVQLDVKGIQVDHVYTLRELRPPGNVQNLELESHGLERRVSVPQERLLACKRERLHRILRLVTPLKHQIQGNQARCIGPTDSIRQRVINEFLSEALGLVQFDPQHADESVRSAQIHGTKVGTEGEVLKLVIWTEEDAVSVDSIVSHPLLYLLHLLLVTHTHEVELVWNDGKLLPNHPLL
mmetsp:Transcript_7077/g.13667  ORF Transcript_7077/g.13667 Transcript_7077/m.13667 type:complete len:221 (-) Transcript_7077:304-966(-)